MAVYFDTDIPRAQSLFRHLFREAPDSAAAYLPSRSDPARSFPAERVRRYRISRRSGVPTDPERLESVALECAFYLRNLLYHFLERHYLRLSDFISAWLATARGWSDLSDMIKLYEKNNKFYKSSNK